MIFNINQTARTTMRGQYSRILNDLSPKQEKENAKKTRIVSFPVHSLLFILRFRGEKL